MTHRIFLIPIKKSPFYRVTYHGKTIVNHSTDPELDACRWLSANGITGTLETWREDCKFPCMTMDIEKAAQYTVKSDKNGTPTFRKLSPTSKLLKGNSRGASESYSPLSGEGATTLPATHQRCAAHE